MWKRYPQKTSEIWMRSSESVRQRFCAKYFTQTSLMKKTLFLVYCIKWKDTRFQMWSSCNRLIVHSLHLWHYDVKHDLANLSNHQNTFLWNSMKNIQIIFFKPSFHKSTFILKEFLHIIFLQPNFTNNNFKGQQSEVSNPGVIL